MTLVGVAGAAGWMGQGGPAEARDDAGPDVAAAPPRAQDVPAELLARIPSGPEALELPVIPPPGTVGLPTGDEPAGGRLAELVRSEGAGDLRIEYSLDAELTRQVFRILRQGRVDLGHVIVMEPRTGRVLAYASTDTENFPPTRTYPAASLVKVITAAAALDAKPGAASLPCRFSGNPYRLTPARIDPPSRGAVTSLRQALATSNNQCFAQLAVHALGDASMLEAIDRFGWTSSPAPAHAAGSVDPGESRYDLGKLGCGLAGCRITPLHAVQLAAVLAHGELVPPRWIDRVVDARGRALPLPALPAPRRVLSEELASELRAMLVDTTTRGTARGAFRNRGRPLLGDIRVAGKTGSLSGKDPKGRYEWFVGVAPADEPRIAVATLLVQGELWWRRSTEIAAQVLVQSFCRDGACRPENADRWGHPVAAGSPAVHTAAATPPPDAS